VKLAFAMNATVIIGFAEALSAPEVAWSLVDRGFNVVAFSRKGRRSSLQHSRFVRVFEIMSPEVDFLQAINQLKAEAVRVKEKSSGALALMPLDDEAVWLCGQADFAGDMIVIGPRGYIERIEDIWEKEINFPTIFKPAMAVQKNGPALVKGASWICADRAELESAADAWAGRMPMLLQRFIPGVGEGLFGLATRQGIVAWSAHRRLRMMNPHGSGASACAVVPKIDQPSQSAAERFIEASGWLGLFMVEMLRDESGNLWFIEFNGRSWGSMALARRSGFEYPAWAVESALAATGTLTDIPKEPDGSLVCRHLGREILHLLFVLRGSKSKALTRWPSIWSALPQVFGIGRNHHWYNWRRDDPKVFFYDCYNTLRDQLSRPS